LTENLKSPVINPKFNNWSTPSSMRVVTLKSPRTIERGGWVDLAKSERGRICHRGLQLGVRAPKLPMLGA
jgi:hypothetical protein